MVFERVQAIFLHDKTAPIVTTLSALIAFILTLIALLAASDKGGLIQYDLVTLNTSTLLQNAIKIETKGTSVTARAVQVTQTPAPTPVVEPRQLGLPGPSQIDSFFNSIGSALSSAVIPQATGTASGRTGSSGLLGDLESFFNDLVGTITGAAGDEILSVTNTLIGDVVSALGIKQWYAVYMFGLCQGDYTPSYSAANAKQDPSSCTSFSNLQINSTNSTFRLGTTTMDFSALNFPAKLSKSGSQIKRVITFIIILQIIGTISAGILIFLTPPTLFLTFFRRLFFRAIITAFAILASTCLGIVAAFETGIQVVLSALVNDLGDGLGIKAYGGGNFLALLWISFVLMLTSATAWFANWHSERYVRRGRELGSSERPVVKAAGSNFNRDG